MPRPGKGGRYHHGDLRAALIDTAIELIGERGVRGFSLAEASRRLGVAVSAPYAHFTDRDDLLAAVTVHGYELCYADLVSGTRQVSEPADRLAAMARGYIRFAAEHRPLFEMLYESGVDKASHPEIEAAERPLTDAFLGCVRALSGREGPGSGEAIAEDWPSRWRPPRTGTPGCCWTTGPAREPRPWSWPPSGPPGRRWLSSRAAACWACQGPDPDRGFGVIPMS